MCSNDAIDNDIMEFIACIVIEVVYVYGLLLITV